MPTEELLLRSRNINGREVIMGDLVQVR
jgi:hypothetical protein